MDEKDMVNGLPSVDDTVSDAPPEPESTKDHSHEGPSWDGEDAAQVSLQKGQPGSSETSEDPEHYGEEGRQEPSQEDYGDESVSQEGAASTSHGNGEDGSQQETPPPGCSYGGQQQETPPPGYSYGGQQETPPPGYSYGGRQETPPPGYGYGPQGYGPYRTPKKNNNMALASLIVGVLSVLLCCCGGFGIILGAVGIVLAILSRGREPMETSAKVGLCLSIGGIILGIAILVTAFAVIGSDEFWSDLYRKGYGDHGNYSHYFEHGGM